MAVDPKRILISGGGIGGLTASLALARSGFSVEVFEQAETVQPIGSGLQLSPNALFVLNKLEIFRQIQRVSTAPNRISVRKASTDRRITDINLGSKVVTRHGLPYYVVHRADLLQVLVAAVRENPAIKLHMDRKVSDLAQHSNGVTVFAGNRKGEGREHTGAMLVAADGVWSKLRTRLVQAPEPQYSGLTAWRAMLRKEHLLPENRISDVARADFENTSLWLHPSAHGVSYPVRSAGVLNLVVITREEEPPRDADGHFEMHRMKKFDPDIQVRGWAKTWPGHLLLPENWTRWPLFHINPHTIESSPWHFENVVLIGDAAHAMLPFAAQGAAMAIEDGWVLAQSLAETPDYQRGIVNFEARRKKRVAKTAELALKNQRIYHMAMPVSGMRNLAMKMVGSSLLLSRQDWLYKWKG